MVFAVCKFWKVFATPDACSDHTGQGRLVCASAFLQCAAGECESVWSLSVICATPHGQPALFLTACWDWHMFGSAWVCDARPIPVWECVVWQRMTCACEHFCFWWQCVNMCMLLSCGSMCVARVTVLCQYMQACLCPMAVCMSRSLSSGSVCEQVTVLWQWQCVSRSLSYGSVCEQVTVLWQYVWACHVCPAEESRF